MSVYIKGEKMPKCCDECWALDDDGDYPRCRITEEQCGYTFRTKENRMSKCPLVNYDNNHESSMFDPPDKHRSIETSWALGSSPMTLKILNDWIVIWSKKEIDINEYEDN